VNVVDTIRTTIECHGLIPAGVRVVAGVSGGADSVALLRAMHELDIPVHVAHLNHRLRGPESDADEAFVRGLASELGLPITVKSADVQAVADAEGLSIEMAARKARHGFFAEFGDAVIALAHHADDQVETFILRLARGAGTEGLSGMPYRQRIGPIRLIRPMLDIPRADLLAWLRAGGCAWREDASNSDESFLRNRVRHTILPLLERELNPNLRATLLRTIDILREENAWMDDLTQHAAPAAAADLPCGARRRILRRWLFENGADEAGFDAVDRILALMDRGTGSLTCELNERQRVVVEYGRPRFVQRDAPLHDPAWMLAVEQGQGWKRDHGRGVGILPAEASFDAEKVGDSPIEVRPPQPGDRIEPMGMEGTRKLQDILTDQKVPKARRTRIPVVVCRGEIIWVPGYRIAKDWSVRGEQGRAVHVRIEQKERV
jgi:tRNA(Ile)-lysidine synthase